MTQINHSNCELLFKDFKHYVRRFSCNVHSNIGNLICLIKSGSLIPYIIHKHDTIVAIYFFRNGQVSYKNSSVIDLVGSILVEPCFKEFFELGLNEAYLDIRKTIPDLKNSKYLNIENISNNNILLKHLTSSYSPLHISPYSYYFYNFAIRPQLPNDTFILC